jgi:preprotein translocase subunit SecA
MASVLEKVLRVGEGAMRRRLSRIVANVNALEEHIKELTDEELAAMTPQLRERYAAGESLDDLLPEAFAAVREAARRTLGLRPFDVQVMGGAALHFGNIAEMKTGEGKTLVGTMPAYLNALTGKGVHVVTVNDFLASYQANIMSRVYAALGMTTGVMLAGQDPATRRAQYAADITYGTNNEFGFDYLKDNMAAGPDELVQRGHHYAIVDEADSILIDEARTPLIISGPAAGEANRWFSEFATIARRLKVGVDYEVDESKRTVGVLEPGIEKVEDHLGIDNLYAPENAHLVSFLNNALKAKSTFKRDKEYVVLDGKIKIVDEHTGRIMEGRRYAEGVHQSIEAKEGVEVQPENQTYATVTLQNYFRLYEKLSGMSGTAETEAAELMSTYKLGVIPIPTNREMQRIDQPDVIYKNEIAKFKQVVEDIAERHRTGQPVLVGTVSVEKSEYLSQLLAQRGVPHYVLNAKNHALESAIVAQAGRLGAVTVATNMAGRGTDIMLGGNAEFLAAATLAERGITEEANPEEYAAAYPQVLEEMKAQVKSESVRVEAAGGLYVLGTERHESRRIDNQLRGRSGRQGDPGESRFYLSLTDDLMRLFNASAAEALLGRSSVPDDMSIESKMVSRALRSAQATIEGRNQQSRSNLLKYDDVMNRQRAAIYKDRAQILHGDDIHGWVLQFLEQTIDEILDPRTVGSSDAWDFDAIWHELAELYPISLTADELFAEHGGRNKLTKAILRREVLSDATLAYERRAEELGKDTLSELEREVVLSTIDRFWREHLYEMDYLKEGIGLRSMAQRDPLVEYQREGFTLYQRMMGGIREESVRTLFTIEPEAAPELIGIEGLGDLHFTAPADDASGEAEEHDETPKA